jgi:hypothetical protein
MASVVDAGANKIKLNNGQTVVAQQGGWYDAQQYWGGTLSAAGVINSLSNQQGAGQKVSAEVNAQTSVAAGKAPDANQTYIDNLNTKGTPTFNNTDEVQNFLNGVQNSTFSASSMPGTPGVQSAADILKDVKDTGLLPTESPTAPNLTQTYQDLSKTYGLDNLQGTINDLTDQERVIQDQLKTTYGVEQGKAVPMNVITGRMTEEQRAANEKLTYIGQQKARAIDQYNSGLTTVKTIMDLTQTDFTNAKSVYDSQFTQAMSMINYIQGVQESQKTDIQRARDNAAANLTIITNAIKSGNMDFASMSASQRSQIYTLEAQAGLPIGFTSALKMDPNANVVATTSNAGQIQVLMRNADGSMSLKTYGTKTGTATDTQKTAISDMNSRLINASDKNGYLTPETWKSNLSLWLSAGLSASVFTSNFKAYADPKKLNDYPGMTASNSTADVLNALLGSQ